MAAVWLSPHETATTSRSMRAIAPAERIPTTGS
eukprot:CAMPEP_0182891448 /NCGR_PEP_ID=MMETSP0034_2-20130328/23263_1 /TAXON_ID=156128 /ORGANISM="Nephroselmis pyriformis, Strain CCMP717" /LENGTH=32 /DNA_ID= /DNA_START= /DNA_END= /DNA_ORIENTATION=